MFFIYYFFVIRNRYIDYFNFKQLAIDFPVFSVNNETGIIGNKCYGNYWAVRRALGRNFDRHCMIEHGVYFGKYVIEEDCLLHDISTIYTYSNYRKDCILSHFYGQFRKKVIELGPYIQYVDNFNSERKRSKIKKVYGKILLVFPSHASPEEFIKYNIKEFLDVIEEIAKDYNSVFISMFWLDIVRGNHLVFQERGFTIVCSGVRNDPYFLNRQRDLIELADMSISNDIGTHIGYCICLGTPHYLLPQKKESVVELPLQSVNYSLEQRNEKEKEEDELYRIFSSLEVGCSI